MSATDTIRGSCVLASRRVRIVAVAGLVAAASLSCLGGRATPESATARGAAVPSVSAARPSEAAAARAGTGEPAHGAQVIDGTGVCPYKSEIDPAHSRAWPGCHVFAPMAFEFPFVACREDKPCLQPCRRIDRSDGAVTYVLDYRYDSGGRLVEEVTRDDAGRSVSTTSYDYVSPRLWRLETSSSFGGKTSTMRFDAAGRLNERVSRFSNGTTLTFRLHYDAEGRLVKEDHISERGGKREDQPIPYAYDDRGRLIARERPHLGEPEFRYVYDAAGNVETVTYHGGDWHVRRDEAGRVVELLEGSRTAERFVYDAVGRLAKVEDGNDTREYSYDCSR